MADCEYIQYRAVCPCGQGSLNRELESPNYPFGRASWSDISFNCSSCSAQWSPDYVGDMLYHSTRHSGPVKAPLDAAFKLRHSLSSQITDLKMVALREELSAAGAKSKAAERRYLQDRGLYAGSYATYLRGGLQVAVSRMDPALVPTCAPLLEQLHMVNEAIRALQVVSGLWLNEHRHEFEFQLDWHL